MIEVMQSVDDFDKAIRELDRLVSNGWAIYRIARRAFKKAGESLQARGSNTASKLLNTHRAKHHKWYDDVYKSIESSTDRNYYWVLFTNAPVNNNYWISGLGPGESTFLINFENRIKVLTDILIMLEERRSTVVRQEIAKQEHDASTKYELKYSTARELTLNGILLAQTDFLSENDKFLTFIFNDTNSWRNVTISELLEYMQVSQLTKTPHQILNDIGITGQIKEIFMPNVSSKGFEFRNPISYSFASDNKLPNLDMKVVRSSQK